VLRDSGRDFWIEDGDGAFYGPKIDILMRDSLGREWQMGTIQLDFQTPRRFELRYAAEDGSLQTPIVIHRAIFGSVERFVGILIEHLNGAFPPWLAPVQAAVIPVTDSQIEYAGTVADQLRKAGLRVEVDTSSERMQAKIRAAQVQKVPWMLVVGKREVEVGTVSVRPRSGDDLGAMPIDAFLDLARPLVEAKTHDLK
jgi:threonyl-tRNA synthetase